MSQALIKVAVVYGGPSEEHEVSRASAAAVLEHLDRSRFEVLPVYVTRTGSWVVADATGDAVTAGLGRAMKALRSCGVALPVMHGRYGEDGNLQAFLEFIGMPYVGSGVLASAAGMDKIRTKQLLAAAGLTVADGVVVTGDAGGVSPADRDRLGLPVFVKPARSGSSIGVTRVDDWAALDEALALARKSDHRVLVEAAVTGREIDVAVLQHPDGRVVASPPLEIRLPAGRTFFDYAAKYSDHATVFEVPADLDPAVTRRLQEQAVTVFHELGCRGLLRVDFFVRPDGSVVVSEVNTAPGLTAKSQVPRMWASVGIGYPDLLTILIETARSIGRRG